MEEILRLVLALSLIILMFCAASVISHRNNISPTTNYGHMRL
nr:hypothetical protein [uncultured Helicobacter sp.]